MYGRTAPTIPVADLERALSFYVGVLGLEKVFENGTPTRFVILQKDRADVHLTLVPGHAAGAHNVMHMLVDDARDLHDRVIAAGATIVKPLRDADFGLRCFVMADPDGNRIDIGEPTP